MILHKIILTLSNVFKILLLALLLVHRAQRLLQCCYHRCTGYPLKLASHTKLLVLPILLYMNVSHHILLAFYILTIHHVFCVHLINTYSLFPALIFVSLTDPSTLLPLKSGTPSLTIFAAYRPLHPFGAH
jgi:hypothetical protein